MPQLLADVTDYIRTGHLTSGLTPKQVCGGLLVRTECEDATWAQLAMVVANTGFDASVPIPVATPSKACVYGRSLVGIVSSNPAGNEGLFLASVACCVGRRLCKGPIICPGES
jgi:hypothetical protein